MHSVSSVFWPGDWGALPMTQGSWSATIAAVYSVALSSPDIPDFVGMMVHEGHRHRPFFVCRAPAWDMNAKDGVLTCLIDKIGLANAFG